MSLNDLLANIAIIFCMTPSIFRFVGIDWELVTGQTAPYIPEVSSPTDTSNFDVDDNDIRQSDAQPPATNPAFSGLHLPFVGFTFTQGSKLSDLGGHQLIEKVRLDLIDFYMWRQSHHRKMRLF